MDLKKDHADVNRQAPNSDSAPAVAHAPSLPSSNRPTDLPAGLNGSNSGMASPTLQNSPQASRTVSPTRQQLRSISSLSSPHSETDKKSREVSPSRALNRGANANSGPSVAAVQKALASLDGNVRQASISSEPASRGVRPSNQGNAPSDPSPLHWPTRLKSPPPSASRRSSLATRQSDNDGDEVRTNVKNGATQEVPAQRSNVENGNSQDSVKTASVGMTVPKLPRGPSGLASKLETVEEGEHSTSPVLTDSRVPSGSSADKRSNEADPQKTNNEHRVDTSQSEVGNETNSSHGPKSSTTKTDESRTQAPKPKRSLSNLAAGKVRPANEGSTKLMTVETETVSSIPQTAAGNPSERGTSGRGEGGGILRSRPSSEGIRQKKEKRKVTRKPTSMMSNTASTKADIFEANVASAVDEADSEDSEETFVYESNPTDARPRRLRHHSRTPSATSMTSLVDRKNGNRSLVDRNVTGKRSMKFSNNSYAGGPAESETIDSNQGTVRVNNNGHSHFGLFGRSGRNSSTQVGEERESPYSQASKMRGTNEMTPRHYSRPNTPKSGNAHYLRTPTRKTDYSPYDYAGDHTDDEETPLVGTVRMHRPSRSRPQPNGHRHTPSGRVVYYGSPPRRNMYSCLAGCLVMTILIVVVLFGVAGFFLATTKPLYDVSVKEIQHVLASEQELMFDLLVQATNPNIVGISISDMDVVIFAKSRHVGTSAASQHHPSPALTRRVSGPHHRRNLHTSDSVDDGTDPMPADPDHPEDGERHAMLLGRILSFDSPLLFEASYFHDKVQTSRGGLRLAKPGNATDAGGSTRWEHALAHPFELIVRGVFQYQLPLSTRLMTTPISASLMVCPDDGDDNDGTGDKAWRLADPDEEACEIVLRARRSAAPA